MTINSFTEFEHIHVFYFSAIYTDIHRPFLIKKIIFIIHLYVNKWRHFSEQTVSGTSTEKTSTGTTLSASQDKIKDLNGQIAGRCKILKLK